MCEKPERRHSGAGFWDLLWGGGVGSAGCRGECNPGGGEPRRFVTRLFIVGATHFSRLVGPFLRRRGPQSVSLRPCTGRFSGADPCGGANSSHFLAARRLRGRLPRMAHQRRACPASATSPPLTFPR